MSKLIMPFGKFRGEELGDVPAWYLLWFADQHWSAKFKEVLEYIEANRQWLEQENKEKREDGE